MLFERGKKLEAKEGRQSRIVETVFVYLINKQNARTTAMQRR